MSIARIHLASTEDFVEIDELILAAYRHDYGPSEASADPMRTAAARAEQFDVWAARDERGLLLASVTTRRAGGPSLHEDVADNELDLRLLGVSPTARRQGIAASLMKHVAAHAARQGFTAVFFKTAPNMSGAHRLYESLGYRRDRDRDGLIIGGKKVLDLYSYTAPVSELAALTL